MDHRHRRTILSGVGKGALPGVIRAKGLRQSVLMGAGSAMLLALVGTNGPMTMLAISDPGHGRASIAEPRSDAGPNTLTGFWSASSAIRTWAITGPLLAALLTRRGLSPQLVTSAGIVQLGDAVLGLGQRNTVMTIAPAAIGIIHLITARVLRAEAEAPALAVATSDVHRGNQRATSLEQAGPRHHSIAEVGSRAAVP